MRKIHLLLTLVALSLATSSLWARPAGTVPGMFTVGSCSMVYIASTNVGAGSPWSYGSYVNYDGAFYSASATQTSSGARRLTEDECKYLLNSRYTPSGKRYAKATVNNVHGMIILPDDWNENYYTLNSCNSASANYDSNIITASDWNDIFDVHGAAFLPAAGYYFQAADKGVHTDSVRR